MELDLQPGDVVKVLESAALGWVRARVIRVESGGRVVGESDQGREFTARGNQVRLIEPAGFHNEIKAPASQARWALHHLIQPALSLGSCRFFYAQKITRSPATIG